MVILYLCYVLQTDLEVYLSLVILKHVEVSRSNVSQSATQRSLTQQSLSNHVCGS